MVRKEVFVSATCTDGEEGTHLGMWASQQRYFKTTGKLSPERIAKLNAIGFGWDHHTSYYPKSYAKKRKRDEIETPTEPNPATKKPNPAATKKKRQYKYGTVEIPGYNDLTNKHKKSTSAHIDFCLTLRDYTNITTTVFTGAAKGFVSKKLKPILKCFDSCCDGDRAKFI
ncbi:unknown protein [Seminavis robusta]|uniref:Helicase-associated domain-containing protein n=1 Tax=Seminavis robusta TaxID=568900 RepID=A0A9N8F0E5_9STRA|nr:unknown protein [Seminavis robusta]|eukprot:Sro3496_g348620.1 n/a (170) ;mRNA; r:1471-1980